MIEKSLKNTLYLPISNFFQREVKYEELRTKEKYSIRINHQPSSVINHI